MRKIVFIFALAAAAVSTAFAASVSTAKFGDIGMDDNVVTNVTFDGLLTEHQDISGKADTTNVYTKAETDARIVNIVTNEVPSIVTNEVPCEWTVTPDSYKIKWNGTRWFFTKGTSLYRSENTDINALLVTNDNPAITAVRPTTTRNALGLARLVDIPPTPGNYTTVSNRAMHAVQTETDPSVPAWAKAQTPPQSMSTNVVCDIVTNTTVVGWTDRWTATPSYEVIVWTDNGWVPMFRGLDTDGIAKGDRSSTNLTWSAALGESAEDIVAYRIPTTQNALGVARLIDLPPLTNGLASASSLSETDARAEDAQNTANAASNTAAGIAATVAAWETYWDGDEVRVTVTNYDSHVHMPSMEFEQKVVDDIGGTNFYRTVWNEMTRWNWFLGIFDIWTNNVNSQLDQKADRAWGYYDSHTGNYAPDDYTWVSSPKIAIAGGLAYQRTLTNEGAIWVLASNGMVSETGGNMTNGFFRIKDDEGNTTFEIVRGNKRTIGATSAGIRVTQYVGGYIVTVPYNVVSETHPTIYGTVSLSSPEWTELDADWLGQSGAWTAQVTTATSTYFIKGEYEIGGETYIKNVAPISAEGGIYCTDGIHKVRPVYNNGTITWEVVP